MTGRERLLGLLNGVPPDEPVASVYITWPEYGWRLSGHLCWELVLGNVDAITIFDRAMQRHPSDFAPGPCDRMGNGWALDKEITGEDAEGVHFRCPKTDREWVFRNDSHVLVEKNPTPPTPASSPPSSPFLPGTLTEAEDWFRRIHEGVPPAPSISRTEDRAIQKWGQDHFMVTCTLAPFVAVIYGLGFETSLTLLAEAPHIFARLEELYLERFEAHFAWAVQIGYDGVHIVDSYCGADTISPATYRNWVAPFHRECAARIHRLGLKADLYIPGYVMPLLPDVRGQGWDILRIEDRCKGIEQDIGEARRILGPSQCLFGNMDAYALLRGDWNEIAARARYQHEAAARTGPFIISNGSGICDQTDPAIVDRWLDYARSLS